MEDRGSSSLNKKLDKTSVNQTIYHLIKEMYIDTEERGNHPIYAQVEAVDSNPL